MQSHGMYAMSPMACNHSENDSFDSIHGQTCLVMGPTLHSQCCQREVPISTCRGWHVEEHLRTCAWPWFVCTQPTFMDL